jgi:hypothetical protein
MLMGACEFPTPDGRIDVLTEDAVIEVRMAHHWNHGIEQVGVYGRYFPERQKVLWLIGENATFYAELAKPHCDRLGIQLRYS